VALRCTLTGRARLTNNDRWFFAQLTHPHADHFSAAHYLQEKTGAPTAIGEHVVDVQRLWTRIYNLPSLPSDGSQWDRLFAHGDRFKIGTLNAHVLFSPGHMLASITYVISDAAFVHDTLFMPDGGTARADFTGGTDRKIVISCGAQGCGRLLPWCVQRTGGGAKAAQPGRCHSGSCACERRPLVGRLTSLPTMPRTIRPRGRKIVSEAVGARLLLPSQSIS
jgi:hypothetical protein